MCRKYCQQDFDATLAVCNHERKQRTKELLGPELRNMRSAGHLEAAALCKHTMDYPRNPIIASSALGELTTCFDLFNERSSHLKNWSAIYGQTILSMELKLRHFYNTAVSVSYP